MKRSLTIFLQVFIVLIGIGTLALMLWEPHIEGRNVNATVFEIYFNDPFLAYAYVASIAFFVGLYQVFKVLGYVRESKTFSAEAVQALRTIKYCAISMIGFVVGAEIFILLSDSDDRSGGLFIGNIIALGSIILAITASKYERILQYGTLKRKS